MTADAARKRAFWQILLLSAGLLVLVAISTTSVVLVNQARKASSWVVHTVEVENQIATLLLEIRRAESAARAFLLNSQQTFLREHEDAVAVILPGINKLAAITSDNPVQVENMKRLRPAVMERIGEFARAVNFVKQNDTPSAVAMLPQTGAGPAVQTIADASRAMRQEEEKLFVQRTRTADETQQLASIVTVAGSALVVLLAALSVFLVRRSSNARDTAEEQLRLNNLNLEATVQERTADLREANEEIQRFAYIVSHDLRSPLVNIMGFTSELETSIKTLDQYMSKRDVASDPAFAEAKVAATEDLPEAITFIRAATRKMDGLINAILKISREGRRQLKPEQVDLNEIVAGATTAIQHQVVENGGSVSSDVTVPRIVSDRMSLDQVLGNLLDNAVKYQQPGRPLEVTIRARQASGNRIEIEVEDNGRGIAATDHERVFELFRRSGVQSQAGEGIGLAHVRTMVRSLGGDITLRSTFGTGTTFTITLPRDLRRFLGSQTA